jgi:hypothetical protein
MKFVQKIQMIIINFHTLKEIIKWYKDLTIPIY